MAPEKMNWEKLLCSERQGEDENLPEDYYDRTPFERDYDRIVFTESFRRLKDKTQVFPITNNDHVRNRLSHSMEVSCIGRSLGRMVGKYVIRKHENVLKELIDKKQINAASFGDIVQTACLAHDIGNPPFGHSGEDAIGSWFKSEIGVKLSSALTPKEREDFNKFEGNAQGFRILTKLESQTGRRGLQLTFATLAAFTKYPRESLSQDLIDKHDLSNILLQISSKKHGFFQSEKEIFNTVAEKVGLIKTKGNGNLNIWCRHPLAFLVEAADDICYRIADLEDGYNMKLISYKTASNLLIKLAGLEHDLSYSCLREENSNEDTDFKGNIKLLRSKAIGKLMKVVAKSFEDNEEEILTGNLHESLLNKSKDEKILETLGVIKEIREEIYNHVYSSSEILLIEIAGFKVISGLLNDYIFAINNDLESNDKNQKGKYHKILKILPGGKKFESMEKDTHCTKQYLKNLQVTDYISGMTDSYAVCLFKQLQGISLTTNI